MSPADQLNMKMEKGELFIDGKRYQKAIKPPSCKEILQVSREMRLERLNMKIARGELVQIQGQQFMGFSAQVKSIQEVNVIYAKIKAMHTDARHVVCACRLPGRNFHTHQDFVDNGEHNGGQFLLRLLESSDIRNRMIIVVHKYDGSHLGPQRYIGMRKAVASAVDTSAQNTISNKYDTIWMDGEDSLKGAISLCLGMSKHPTI